MVSVASRLRCSTASQAFPFRQSKTKGPAFLDRRIEAFLDPSVSAPAESSDSDLDPCRLDSDDSDYSLRNRDTRAYIE